QQVFLNFRILESPEHVVDEVVMDVDEQHRRGEEEEHLPGVEGAEHGVDLVGNALACEPAGEHDGKRQDRAANLRLVHATQARVFHLVDKREVLQRVEEGCPQEIQLV